MVERARSYILKTITMLILVLGATATAMANSKGGGLPEIDPGASVNALALLGGALLLIRGRRRR